MGDSRFVVRFLRDSVRETEGQTLVVERPRFDQQSVRRAHR
jgi:hypothetical protein